MQTSGKVTFFVLNFYRGGGTRVFIEVANGFVARGIPVDFIVMDSDGPFKERLDTRVRVVSMPSRRIIGVLPKLIRHLKDERPTVLMAANKHTHLLAVWAKLWSRTTTRVVLRVGMPYSYKFYKLRTNPREFLVPFFMKIFYRYADGYIAVSEGVARDLSKACHISRNRISVIYNPLPQSHSETEMRAIDHPWLQEKRDTPVIVTLGRLERQKDHATLIRACARLKSEGVKAKLLILGQGGLRDSLRSLARELGVERDVDIPGSFVTEPMRYFARADIFALSSIREGFPSVLIEALAAGVPTISTDCEYGPREILSQESFDKKLDADKVQYAKYGILVAIAREDMFAKGLKQLLTDSKMYKYYAAAAKKRGGDFDTGRVIDQYRDILIPNR